MAEPNLADMAHMKSSIDNLTIMVADIKRQMEQIVRIDKEHSNTAQRVDTAEKNITMLWDKHAEQQDRWTRHDADLGKRNEDIQRGVGEKVKAAEKLAIDADAKVEAVINRFRGVGYAWVAVGALVICGIGWLVGQVSTLSNQVAVLNYRAQAQGGKS